MTRLTDSQNEIVERLVDESREMLAALREMRVSDCELSAQETYDGFHAFGELVENLVAIIQTLTGKINEGDACQN